MTDIREVIAEAMLDEGAQVEECRRLKCEACKEDSLRVADAVLAAIEAAPVERRLAWAARLVGPDHVVKPLNTYSGLSAAIQAGAVKGEQ